MRYLGLSSLSAALAALLAACSNPATEALDRAGSARLDALRDAPESAGGVVYQGEVFPLRPAGARQLYSYERRVTTTREGLSASHITRDANREVVIVESAEFTPAYELRRFAATNKQAGYTGTVRVTGSRHLEFVLNQGGKVTMATGDATDPVVTGPSLHGFILRHWDLLAAGQRVPVRMVVMEKKQTYGFEIVRANAANGRTAFSVTATNFLVRLAIEPLRVEFDSAAKHVLRYEGRVPPMQMVNGRLRALDARVEYTMHAPAYR